MNKQETKPWEQQKGEKDKPYYFFQQYINIEDNITIDKYYKKILKESQENTKNSYNIPKLNTVYSWTKKFDWIKRKEAYRSYLLSRVGDEISELFVSSLVEKFKIDSENRLLISKEINGILKDDNFKGSKAWHIEKLMKSNKDGLDIERLIAGEPTEIIKSENDNTHQVTGLDNLANTLETSRQKRKKTSEKGV